jgi:hypothetical protein
MEGFEAESAAIVESTGATAAEAAVEIAATYTAIL